VTSRLEFTVVGESVSQGSLTAVPTNRNWRTVPGVRWTVKDAKFALKAWRKLVADTARDAHAGAPLLEGPINVDVYFIFERPSSHFGTGKNKDVLKPSAPGVWVTSHQKGDLDKHLRALLDSLTGTVYKDDSQVSSATARKVYGSRSCVRVTVTEMDEITPLGDRSQSYC
jgi:Holliday junction resolvase RusA-like endonuclease